MSFIEDRSQASDIEKMRLKVKAKNKGLWSSHSVFFICSIVIALWGYALQLEANVTGNCSNCHTMHNSQNGMSVAVDRSMYGTPPYGNLLKDTCVGCHMATNGATWKDPFTGAPIVFNTSAPQYGASSGGGPKQGLAGGNFYWVAAAGGNDPTKGHNVWGISGQDPNLADAPGAQNIHWGCATPTCHQTLATNPASTTSPPNDNRHKNGCEGCHLYVSHHTDSGCYRYLCSHGYPGDASHGIRGAGDPNWESNPSSTTHNTYIAAAGQNLLSWGYGNISAFCAGCHWKFHTLDTDPNNGIGIGSPWFRHPTDVVMPASGEYSVYTIYSLIAPVGRPEGNFPADPSQVRPGTDMATCISCHRVHGSPYFKMMRWDYKSSTLSTALSGCNECHTSKN